MHVQNLEPGLRRAMTAVFRQKGLSEDQASSKVTRHLEAAREVFSAACRIPSLVAKKGRGPRTASFQRGSAPLERAMRAVVKWAHGLP